MAERADTLPSDQVVPEVTPTDGATVMVSMQPTENTADTYCAKLLVELVAGSQELSSVGCAESSNTTEADAHLPAPTTTSDGCLIPPKSLKRECPTLVYRRRKHQVVTTEFAGPTTIKLAERLRYNFSRCLSLGETGPPQIAVSDQDFRYLRKKPVDHAEMDIDHLCGEHSIPPKQSE